MLRKSQALRLLIEYEHIYEHSTWIWKKICRLTNISKGFSSRNINVNWITQINGHSMASDLHCRMYFWVNALKRNGFDIYGWADIYYIHNTYITSHAQNAFLPFVLLDDPLQLDLYVCHLCLFFTIMIKNLMKRWKLQNKCVCVGGLSHVKSLCAH